MTKEMLENFKMITSKNVEDFFGVWIQGTPVAKARPRVTRSGHTYTPAKTANAERQISDICQQIIGFGLAPKFPQGTPVFVEIRLGYPRPKKPINKDFPIGKSDLDNAAKTICDGMNQVIYHDDNQVVSLKVNRVYSNTGLGFMFIVVRKAQGDIECTLPF
jgi:Holliday junction resolvase RusA-like endonuclease